ncbi:hypothetical protein U1Q18_050894 [Sarracenia purpurea var. burkii]
MIKVRQKAVWVGQEAVYITHVYTTRSQHSTESEQESYRAEGKWNCARRKVKKNAHTRAAARFSFPHRLDGEPLQEPHKKQPADGRWSKAQADSQNATNPIPTSGEIYILPPYALKGAAMHRSGMRLGYGFRYDTVVINVPAISRRL